MLMKTKCWIAAAALASVVSGGFANSQMANAQMKSDAGHDKSMAMSGDSAGKSMDDVLSIYEHDIVGAAEAMPADKYNFSPTQADFKAGKKVDFDSPKPVMTFAQEVKHLAQANYGFYSAGGAKPDVDVKAIGDLKSKDEIVAALKKSYAFAHQSVLSMTAANGFDTVEAEGRKSTRASAYAFGLAHMGDHYGQLVEYLRMNGIVPPASKR